MKLLISASAAKKLPESANKVNTILKNAVKSVDSFKGGSITVQHGDERIMFVLKTPHAIDWPDLKNLASDLSFIADGDDWLQIQSGPKLIIRMGNN